MKAVYDEVTEEGDEIEPLPEDAVSISPLLRNISAEPVISTGLVFSFHITISQPHMYNVFISRVYH